MGGYLPDIPLNGIILMCTKQKLSPEGLDAKRPKQLKLPNQAYIDLPLGKDEKGLSSAEPDSFEEGNSASSTNSTPQMTPTDSLSRTLQRKKTDSVLYGCTVLLASVALGLDIRELNRLQNPEEVLHKEEKKKRDGLFQRASKFRRSSSPERLQSKKEGTHITSVSPSANTVNLLSLSSASSKCLLQSNCEDTAARTLPSDRDGPIKCLVAESPVNRKEQIVPATGSNFPCPSPLLKQECQCTPNVSSPKVKVMGHRRTVSDGNPCHAATNGVPEVLLVSSLLQRNLPISASPEKQGPVNIIPRPRPSSLRSRLDPWQAVSPNVKLSPFEMDHLKGDRGSKANSLTDPEARTKSHMPSLLDIDVEGQNSDCTVPLCRLKSKSCRPSIYELEKEFLS
uniref:Uncharacterized protein n=1 Tax=Sphaerodactylus townsendi TaxID=933632 RepID=A0ACB8GBI3_9SAUR